MLENFFRTLSEFTAAQPPALQWLSVFAGGALPFVESYYGSVIGVVVGVHPVAAIVCAVMGNIASTTGCIAVAHTLRIRRLRRDISATTATLAEAVKGGPVLDVDIVGGGSGPGVAATSDSLSSRGGLPGASGVMNAGVEASQVDEVAKGLKNPKLRRRFERYGVPGVCLGSQSIMPSQITAVILVGMGASPREVAIWQCISISLWGIAYGALATLGVGLLT